MKDKRSDETMASIIEKRSIYYTTILSHFITRDGKQMICGLKGGKLALFNIYQILKQNIDFDNKSLDDRTIDSLEPIRRPKQIVSCRSPVYSLATIGDKAFVCGSKGQIQGWVIDDNNLSEDLTFSLSSNECMVNTLSTTDQMIFAGCGDHNIYGFDIETQKQTISLSEHKDYINCVLVSNQKTTLYSGSEDGSVLVWDLRAKNKSVSEIIPHQNSQLSRPNYGKWIGALALASNNWLICGGGPHLSLWHLNSLSYASKFKSESTTNVIQLHNEYIISGGNASDLHIWEMNGELKSLIPTSVNNVFSISTHEYKDNDLGIEQLITSAGMSYKIDISTNWKYKDFEILVY